MPSHHPSRSAARCSNQPSISDFNQPTLLPPNLILRGNVPTCSCRQTETSLNPTIARTSFFLITRSCFCSMLSSPKKMPCKMYPLAWHSNSMSLFEKVRSMTETRHQTKAHKIKALSFFPFGFSIIPIFNSARSHRQPILLDNIGTYFIYYATIIRSIALLHLRHSTGHLNFYQFPRDVIVRLAD